METTASDVTGQSPGSARPGPATVDCGCDGSQERRRFVLTGGPEVGKTAVLELVLHSLCRHVKVLQEAAGIVFGGGFPRTLPVAHRRAAQRAIFHVQRELEVIGDVEKPAVVLCDRGRVDGLAYWPGPVEDFWRETGTNAEAELARYDVVVHLRTPSQAQGTTTGTRCGPTPPQTQLRSRPREDRPARGPKTGTAHVRQDMAFFIVSAPNPDHR